MVDSLKACISGNKNDCVLQALTGKNGFINRLKDYHNLRNDPNANAESNMSPYLHFGQLSAQQMATVVSEQKGKYRVSLSKSFHTLCVSARE